MAGMRIEPEFVREQTNAPHPNARARIRPTAVHELKKSQRPTYPDSFIWQAQLLARGHDICTPSTVMKKKMKSILVLVLMAITSSEKAHANMVLLCDGMFNKFRRPAPVISLQETPNGYLLTMTDRLNQAAIAYSLSPVQLELKPDGSGFGFEIRGQRSFSNKILSIRTLDLALPSKIDAATTTEATSGQQHEIAIGDEYGPSALHWGGIYRSGTCHWNLGHLSKKLKLRE